MASYRRVLLGIVVCLSAAAAARAECPLPQIDRSYQTKDGTTVNVYTVPQGTEGEDCTAEAEDDLADDSRGNSRGTTSFEMAADPLAVSSLTIVDGTTLRMRGLPRIANGRIHFTNEQGQLVQLPLREVVATDSGRRFGCAGCARDAAGRPLAGDAARQAFLAATPCPAPGASGGGCPGYVVDHATPLACGGDDVVQNLQWQREAEVARKEAWVAKACPSGR